MKRGKKKKEKMKKVWSMDKTLVGTKESAGVVIRRYSVNKVFLESVAKCTGKYLCWSLFLMTFQALRPASLLRSDSSKGVFL